MEKYIELKKERCRVLETASIHKVMVLTLQQVNIKVFPKCKLSGPQN